VISRRTFLAGGLGALVAAGGGNAWALDRDPGIVDIALTADERQPSIRPLRAIQRRVARR
jgi:hypothetical protein